MIRGGDIVLNNGGVSYGVKIPPISREMLCGKSVIACKTNVTGKVHQMLHCAYHENYYLLYHLPVGIGPCGVVSGSGRGLPVGRGALTEI